MMQNLVFGDIVCSRQNIRFDMHRTIVLKRTLLFISNLFDNIGTLVTKYQQQQLRYIFCFSCNSSKSEVTMFCNDNDDFLTHSITLPKYIQ